MAGDPKYSSCLFTLEGKSQHSLDHWTPRNFTDPCTFTGPNLPPSDTHVSHQVTYDTCYRLQLLSKLGNFGFHLCLPPIPPNHHQFLDEPYFVMQDASSILRGMFIKRRKPGNCIVREKKNQLRYFIATHLKYGCLLCMGLLRSPLFCPTDLS